MTWTDVACVFAGGGIGSVCRFLISRSTALQTAYAFPWPTFAVNVIGSFLIGLLAGLFVRHIDSEAARLALVVGFCGGFTTFSTFSRECLVLIQEGNWHTATVYVLLSVLLGIAAVLAGVSLTK